MTGKKLGETQAYPTSTENPLIPRPDGSWQPAENFGCQARPGMTLRQAFAMHAPTLPDELWGGIIGRAPGEEKLTVLAGSCAAWATSYADALLEALAQSPPGDGGGE